MAADRETPTLADYAVTAISPVLIMLMVGSLVFFLVEVLYAGQYSERLLYTMFFFVGGAVLIARIAIQIDSARAAMYGAGLALVTFLAMNAYVDYPPGTPFQTLRPLVNIGLMAIVWWSAHRLTWDCTHIDENRDASGRGLLSAAGLAESDAPKESEAEEKDAKLAAETSEAAANGKKKSKKNRKKKGPTGFSGWVGRWREYREKQKNKPHTPGVWVIYFALAALPLFAIGQSLIPADDADRRRATFLQMAVYVGSGLALLVTTSFLGLRRYLRQRKAKVPATLTVGWLGLGALLIVVFLTIGAFLPRPHSEVPWFGLPRAGKSEREASEYAQLGDSAGKGEGAEGDQSEKGNGSASGKNGEPGGSKGEKGSGGKGQGKKSGGQSGKGEKGNDGKSQSGEKSEDDKNGDEKDQDDKDQADKNGDNAKSGDKTTRQGKDAKGKSGSRERSGTRSQPETKLGAALQKVAGFVKWLVIAVVVILVVIGIALAVLRYLSPFTAWARNLLDAIRNWWANLFGKKPTRAREEEVAVIARGPQRPPPFNTFSNPFEDGTADGRNPAELVEYTFLATDAWAWDRDHGRPPTETALEFADRLGNEFPDFHANFRRLANLYARVLYAQGTLPTDAPQLLEQVWDQLVHGVTAAEPVEV